MNYDVSSPFKRATVDRSREGVVNNQGDPVTVCDTCELFNIQHFQRRIGNCFAKQSLCIRFESCRNFFFAGIRIYESHIDAEFLHRHSEQVERTSINSGRTNEVISCLADIKNGIEVGCLTAGSQHSGYTTFKSGDFGGNGVIRWILQAGIKVTTVFQIEQAGHLLAGIVFESCTLIDGQYAWFAFFRRPSSLYTQGFRFELFCHNVIGF